MKKILLLTAIAAMLAGCNDTKEAQVALEPSVVDKVDEVVQEEPQQQTTNKVEDSVSETVEPEQAELTTAQRDEIKKLLGDYVKVREEAIASGDTQVLASGYLSHHTEVYGEVIDSVNAWHDAGVSISNQGLAINVITRDSDTQFTVKTTELEQESKDGVSEDYSYERQYTLYYDYVEDQPEEPAFFKIVAIKKIK